MRKHVLRAAILTVATGMVLPLSGMTASSVGASLGAAGANADTVDARVSGSRLQYPRRANTGVPRGWEPVRTINGDKTVSRRGAIIKDVRIKGDLVIAARDVRVVRVDVVGGSINNWVGSDCQTGLSIRRTTIRRAPGESTSGDEPALQAGGYVAQRVLVDGLPEGFRVGGKRECGKVVLRRSYARVVSPDDCGDWHGDALQGYDGAHVKIRNSRLDLVERDDCGGTAPFFYPRNQGNTSVDIDGLIVKGGGYSFRLGMPGDVRNLKIVRGGYHYGPIDVDCSAVDTWQAHVVKLDKQGQPRHLRRQRCNSNGGY